MHELRELCQVIELLEHLLKKEHITMQVQYTLTLTITPPTPPPLTEGSSSGTFSFPQGQPFSQILTPITGGVTPYTPSVDAASPTQLPPGVALSIDANNNLVLSGTPSASGSGVILIDVNDAQGNSVAQVKAHVTT